MLAAKAKYPVNIYAVYLGLKLSKIEASR